MIEYFHSSVSILYENSKTKDTMEGLFALIPEEKLAPNDKASAGIVEFMNKNRNINFV